MTSIGSKFASTALWVAVLALAWTSVAVAGDLENGKLAYTTNCLSCHGEKGDGKGPVGAFLQAPPRDLTTGQFSFDTDKDGQAGTDVDLTAVIKNGAAVYGGSPLMTPWAQLSDEDIEDIVIYIRSLLSP